MRWAYVYVSQLFSEMVFTGMFIPVSLVNFYFATQCVQSRFPSSPFLFSLVFCFFKISFVMQTQVFMITLLRQFKSFVFPLDFLSPCRTGLQCGNPQFWENRCNKGCLFRALWGSGRSRAQITNRSEVTEWFWQSCLGRVWYLEPCSTYNVCI